jgi:sec-independent protein translocase protein TatA
MGLSGVSFWEILLILVVLLLLFGSKKLPGIASDLGSAIRDFRRSISQEPGSQETGSPAGAAGDSRSAAAERAEPPAAPKDSAAPKV